MIREGSIGSFRGGRGPAGVPAAPRGRSRGPDGQGFNRLEGAFFGFEGLFIVFFVMMVLLNLSVGVGMVFIVMWGGPRGLLSSVFIMF